MQFVVKVIKNSRVYRRLIRERRIFITVLGVKLNLRNREYISDVLSDVPDLSLVPYVEVAMLSTPVGIVTPIPPETTEPESSPEDTKEVAPEEPPVEGEEPANLRRSLKRPGVR